MFVTVTPHATRQLEIASHLLLSRSRLNQTNGAYLTRYTHMNTNPKSANMSHYFAPNIDKVSLIRGLNPAQRKGNVRSPSICAGLLLWSIAVEHEPNIPLQILAGPGSGKTKVPSGKRAYTVPSYSDIDIKTSKGSYI